MMTAYTTEVHIRRGSAKGSVLTLRPEMAAALGLKGRQRVLVHFGRLCRTVRPAVLPSADRKAENELTLSQDVMDALRLPDYPVYDLCCENGELSIGPLIGLLLHRRNRSFTTEGLKKLPGYAENYSEVRGALVAFALDRADLAADTVEGFCYNPETKTFDKGIFPFPTAIYRTVGLSNRWKNRIAGLIGDGMFNCPYFTKKDMAAWLAENPVVAPHLPETRAYEGIDQVLMAAHRHGAVFLKPSRGLGGHGIIRIAAQKDGGWEFRFHENSSARVLHCVDDSEAIAFLKTRGLGASTLVQQAVALPEHEGRVYDFRCFMQKDAAAQWHPVAVIGRRSAKGSVVSNISSGGRAFRPENMPETEISPPGFDAHALQAKIEAFALEVCAALDACGLNCGTLGVDIGVDQEGRLWLFEANNRDPDPTLALDLGDSVLYRRLKCGPLLYARALAGFQPAKEAIPQP